MGDINLSYREGNIEISSKWHKENERVGLLFRLILKLERKEKIRLKMCRHLFCLLIWDKRRNYSDFFWQTGKKNKTQWSLLEKWETNICCPRVSTWSEDFKKIFIKELNTAIDETIFSFTKTSKSWWKDLGQMQFMWVNLK